MPEPFRRSSPKIGRNDLCICGSGRKFKHCHGQPQFALPNLIASADLDRQIIAEGKRQLERHKAHELQRQKQQGCGRPIISVEHQGYRFVAVGSRLHYGKWKTFIDFLGNYIKEAIGSDWGNAEIAKPLEERHPVMQWYDRLCHLQSVHVGNPGELFSTPITGAVSAYNRLAYNLYLIAHNGKDIQTLLLARLKNQDNFQGAYYETQVAAWLIRAGFELDFENEQDRSSTHCEFTATYVTTGEKYSVEAKSRQTRLGGAARTPVGKQIRKALVKKADYKRWISTFEMTPEELIDYARHPDTFFGVYKRQPKGLHTIMDMYDFFTEGYVNTHKDKLIELLPNYPDQEELRRLSQKELVEIAAESFTYGAMSSRFKFKTREELRKERRGYGPEAVEVVAQQQTTEDSSSQDSLT